MLPIAGSLPNALAPIGTDFSQIQGSSTSVELRQLVTRTVTTGSSSSPRKLGLRQLVSNLKGALNQAGPSTQEEVAYTKYALYSEFGNAARQYEDEARVVRDYEVAQAARQASQRTGQQVSYLEQNSAQLKKQLDGAVRGEHSYLGELQSIEITNKVLVTEAERILHEAALQQNQPNQTIGQTQAQMYSLHGASVTRSRA